MPANNFIETVRSLEPSVATVAPVTKIPTTTARNLVDDVRSYKMKILEDRLVSAFHKAGYKSLGEVLSTDVSRLQVIRSVGTGVRQDLDRARLLLKLEEWSKKVDFGLSFNSVRFINEILELPTAVEEVTADKRVLRKSPVFSPMLGWKLHYQGINTVKEVLSLTDEQIMTIPSMGIGHLKEIQTLRTALKRTPDKDNSYKPSLLPPPVRTIEKAKVIEKKEATPVAAVKTYRRDLKDNLTTYPIGDGLPASTSWEKLTLSPDKLAVAIAHMEGMVKVSPWRKYVKAGHTPLGLATATNPFIFSQTLAGALSKKGYATAEQVLDLPDIKVREILRHNKVKLVDFMRSKTLYTLEKMSLESNYGHTPQTMAFIKAVKSTSLRTYTEYHLEGKELPVFKRHLSAKLAASGFKTVKDVLDKPLVYFLELSKGLSSIARYGGQSLLEIAYLKSLLTPEKNDYVPIPALVPALPVNDKLTEDTEEVRTKTPAVVMPQREKQVQMEEVIPGVPLPVAPLPAPLPEPTAVNRPQASTTEGGLFAFKIRHEEEIKGLIHENEMSLRDLFKRLKQQDAKEVSLTLIKLCMLQEIKIKKAKVFLEN
jgi:hypothetical protein